MIVRNNLLQIRMLALKMKDTMRTFTFYTTILLYPTGNEIQKKNITQMIYIYTLLSK